MFRAVLKEQLDKFGALYNIDGLGEIEFKKNITPQQLVELSGLLSRYGIEIIDDYKNELVQRIKDAITELVYSDNEDKSSKLSEYLSCKLNYSYAYLATVFSEATYSSIENFVILKKIDYAKGLIISNQFTLTEIAYKLNYSSVAHLSAQFKKTTGLTPTSFQSIIKKRKEI
jgi:AraC-like DNA-binding protein